jgi:transposase
MAYSDDLRQSLLHAVDSHTLSQTALARLFAVSLSYLKNVVQRRQQTGNTHSLPHGGGPTPKLSPAQQEALRHYLAQHPAALLKELASWLESEQSVRISISALCRVLRRLGLRRKKERGTPVNATRRPIRRNASSGVPPSRRSNPRTWSLSMKAE